MTWEKSGGMAIEHAPKHVPRFTYVNLTWPRPAVAQLTLHRPPVNAMNLQVWSELEKAFNYVETLFPTHTRALVLCSGLQRSIFSAGNDITELYAPSTTRRRFFNFWQTSTRAITKLYTLPLVTIAAANGACPAGGCVLALCCDIRIISESTKIGLNESALGIPVPRYWAHLLLSIATNRAIAERLLLDGVMMKSKEALDLKLVDCVVSEDVIQSALSTAQKNAAVNVAISVGRAKTKHNIRAKFAEDWLNYANIEMREAWTHLSNKETVDTLGTVLKRLSRAKM